MDSANTENVMSYASRGLRVDDYGRDVTLLWYMATQTGIAVIASLFLTVLRMCEHGGALHAITPLDGDTASYFSLIFIPLLVVVTVLYGLSVPAAVIGAIWCLVSWLREPSLRRSRLLWATLLLAVYVPLAAYALWRIFAELPAATSMH